MKDSISHIIANPNLGFNEIAKLNFSQIREDLKETAYSNITSKKKLIVFNFTYYDHVWTDKIHAHLNPDCVIHLMSKRKYVQKYPTLAYEKPRVFMSSGSMFNQDFITHVVDPDDDIFYLKGGLANIEQYSKGFDIYTLWSSSSYYYGNSKNVEFTLKDSAGEVVKTFKLNDVPDGVIESVWKSLKKVVE